MSSTPLSTVSPALPRPLPALDSLESPIKAPGATVGEATSVVREILALLQGDTAPLGKSMAFHLSSALRVAVEAHVAETLREAAAEGKDSLTADEIAKSSTIDPSKLGRILRLLAANHVFFETKANSFTLNRPALSKEPYSGTNGFAALVAHCADDVFKGSAFLSEVLLDPKTSHSTSPTDSAIVVGGGLGKPVWEHLAGPGNEHLLSRFGPAMIGTRTFGASTDEFSGFPFRELPEGATVVDVGGGVGNFSLPLAKSAPQIRIVLQDRPEVINDGAQKVWEEEANAVKSGRVQLLAHDFFEPKPIKGADIYFLRVVICVNHHDWADEYAIEILRRQADAASPSSKLVLMEQAIDTVPPSGRVHSLLSYYGDLQMLTAINAKEHTAEQYAELGRKAGWKMVKVYKLGEGGSGELRQYEFNLV